MQHSEDLEATAPRSWPELKGKTFSEAEAAIKHDRPDAEVIKIPEGSPVTFDYRPWRVRIFVNDENVVVDEPRTG